MNALDKILEEQGLTYEDLNTQEKETYNQQYFNIKGRTVEDLKQCIVDMKNSIALQLTDVPFEDFKKDLTLKARLKNYILIEAFLTTPDKAERALRESLKNIKKGK